MATRRTRRRALAAAAFVGAVAVAAGGREAGAQSLRPHVLFIVDTSGSMQENASGSWVGENTNICPGPTTSKMYGLKAAMRAALAEAGTDEANFGLFSFPLRTITPNAYPSGWCRTSGSQAGRVGHYEPTPAQSGRNLGCDITSHTGQTTYGSWFGTGGGEVIRVGVTTAAATATPMASNYDPVDGNIPAIYRWIDNVELPMNTGPVTDPELHGMNYTPLGRSLFYSRMYFDNLVKPQDPKASCRKNVVILVTDGAETCDTTAPNNTFDLTTCTGGGNFNAFHPVVQACQLFRTSGIKTYVVTDTGLSSGDLAANDRIAAAGGTTAAVRVSLANAGQAKTALTGIIAETVPPAETCNGLDDNCNGQVDEGVSNMCPLDLTTLRHCAVETANCLDDNCNGRIDEGFPPNACGQGAGCPVPPERCDGVDNDCDGDIDEGFDVGAACDNGLTGTCRRRGLKECTPDGMGTTCVIPMTPTGTEICNGLDDDCNGMVDDGLGPGQGIGVPCGVQTQMCQAGVTRCVGGKIICDSVSSPQPEVCNGRDDDCNGVVDDGTFPTVGNSCLCPGLDAAQAGVGTCRAGKIICAGAEGLKCSGCVLPTPEICDGKDNNCDGQGDEDAKCPSGFACQEGKCELLCQAGEFQCPPGYDCKGQFCVPNRCRNVSCDPGMKCDDFTGNCVDVCHGVTCLPGQRCEGGRCVDCHTKGCPSGQICINRECIKDVCAGISCPAGQYCAKGSCVSLTCGGCPSGHKCIAGQCRIDKCGGVLCNPGTYCEPATGQCKQDRCATRTCEPMCSRETGECLPAACAAVSCPTNGCWTCELTPAGEPYCAAVASCIAEATIAGAAGGGCSCSMGPEQTSVGAILASLLTMAFASATGARRRRGIRG